MKALAVTTVALVLAAGSAAAQQRINETRPAAPGGTVEVTNIAGSVRVVPWNRSEVQVTGTLGRGTERLDFTTEGNRTRIRVIVPRNAGNVGASDLEVRVPARSSPAVQTTSADIEITAEQAETLRATTVSGRVRLNGSSGSVEAESVSGDLEIAVASPQTRAKSVSGNLTLRGTSGSVEATTVSGNAGVEAGRLERLSLTSVSGRLQVRGALTRGGSYRLSSHSGDIELRLPAAVAADFEITTFSGDVANAFGPGAERVSRYTPGRELRFTAGGGGARVEAKTFSGDVRLVRQ